MRLAQPSGPRFLTGKVDRPTKPPPTDVRSISPGFAAKAATATIALVELHTQIAGRKSATTA